MRISGRRFQALVLSVSFISVAEPQPLPAQRMDMTRGMMTAPAAVEPQAPAVPVLPTAHEVFEHYAQAIGGREAWQKLKSRVSRGIVHFVSKDGTDTSGSFVMYERAANQAVTTVILPNGLVFRKGFDGHVSWDEDPTGKVRILEGARAADLRADSDFYAVINLETLCPDAKTIGQRTVDDRLAYVVEAAVPGGSLRWLYFDAKSWLKFRVDVFDSASSSTPAIVQLRDDFREVDGIKYPYRWSAQAPTVTILYQFTVLSQNVPVTDDQVARPVSASD